MKQIFVKEKEHREYEFNINNKNRIYIFWKTIVSSVPLKLINELKIKQTDLILDSSINKAKEIIIYRFLTKNGSIELINYLKEYAVFVENDTNKVLEWRKNIINWLLHSKSNRVLNQSIFKK